VSRREGLQNGRSTRNIKKGAAERKRARESCGDEGEDVKNLKPVENTRKVAYKEQQPTEIGKLTSRRLEVGRKGPVHVAREGIHRNRTVHGEAGIKTITSIGES